MNKIKKTLFMIIFVLEKTKQPNGINLKIEIFRNKKNNVVKQATGIQLYAKNIVYIVMAHN